MAARDKGLARALIGAVIAGSLLLAMPAGLIETIVSSSGLSETLPAAAPPLGWKARLMVSAFGAVMTLGLIWASEGGRQGERGVHAPRQNGRRKRVSGVRIMGFALSKLNWLARSRRQSPSPRTPALRRADAHPDAPARAPIFASRDFGGLDIFARTVPGRNETETTGFALPAAAVPDESAFATRPPPAVGEVAAPRTPDADLPEGRHAAPDGPDPRSLSIAELTERLERGLAARKRTGRTISVLADMPVERAVPVRDHVEQDVDQALRAALGTLRTMAGRAR